MSIHPFSGPGPASMDTPEEVTGPDLPSDHFVKPLDVIRGVAVLGLLVVSIWEFAGFTPNLHIYYQRGPHGGNYALLTAISILFEGKMLALFAMVFGAGIVLFLTKQHPTTVGVADLYMRRQLWLLFFGLFVAFILLFPGDILYPFAVVGILIFGFWRFSAKGLATIAVVFLLIFFGKQFWNYQDDKKDYKKYLAVTAVEKRIKADSSTRAKKDSTLRTKDTVLIKDVLAKNKLADSIARKNDTLTKKQKEEKGKWEGIVKATKYDSAKTAALNKSMREVSYSKVWDNVMKKSQDKESFWLYRIGLWEIGSMMLLGMALFKSGFFEGKTGTGKYFAMGLLFILLAAGLGWYRLHFNNMRLGDYEGFVKTRMLPYNFFIPLENMLMAAGYAALIMWMIGLNALTWLLRAIGYVGSMALTNYVLQCLVCSSFFYGYAFGYFGKLEQVELYVMVAELTLIQLVLSVLWLRYFTIGPLEWLWSCLIYRKWFPIKKPVAVMTEPLISTVS